MDVDDVAASHGSVLPDGLETSTATEILGYQTIKYEESHEKMLQPFEIANEEDGYLSPHDESHRFAHPAAGARLLATPSVVVSLVVLVPALLGIIGFLFRLTGRMFVTAPFCLHLFGSAASGRSMATNSSPGWKSQLASSIASLLDIILLGLVYPKIWNVLIDAFFTDIDGTIVIEWADELLALRLLVAVGRTVACLRFLLGSLNLTIRIISFSGAPGGLANFFVRGLEARIWGVSATANLVLIVSGVVLLWSLISTLVHFYPWSPPLVVSPECDPMDTTECWLPFPSMEYMQRDNTTATGWRVDLKGHLLPPLKGRIEMDPTFLNNLDGFSTMGSILFYMSGLKEAHEAGVTQLQGPSSIAGSVTPRSVTLLVDINASTLVAHSAEIDYLDPARPLVMVFPAQPLRHANHYALAVVNATDDAGHKIEPAPHLTLLLSRTAESGGTTRSADRAIRYAESVIPALERAAPWLALDRHPDVLQLLFDFVTVSGESQLGSVRAVRDAALAHIKSPEWGSWSQHVRVIKRVDNDCTRSLVARTVHAEIDVPWFLDGYGRGHRGAVLDMDSVARREPSTIGAAKLVVHVPCSLRSAALGRQGVDTKPLRAIMEYGHGLFFSRQEASDHFLLQMAHNEGYVIMAMDWRGMSVFDLLVVGRVLLSRPRLFQAVRDNLIQGYANKLAMAHFSQNGMLSMDWFRFEGPVGETGTVPLLDGKPPTPVFYGISQGGILGAGYVSLSGLTGLFERAVLGVPGTPFAMIMTRSLDFVGYDKLLLLNFYDNRHVRGLLALVQMAWDSVEGSGVLATPVREPIPRLLLQAGLGDAVVPSIAAEALARGLNASVLPNNPRLAIYGVPVAEPADGAQDGPPVTLTEIMYEEEYSALPVDDKPPALAGRNRVHLCVRLDPVMIGQIAEFINTGRVIDVCVAGGCRRDRSC